MKGHQDPGEAKWAPTEEREVQREAWLQAEMGCIKPGTEVLRTGLAQAEEGEGAL